MDKYLLTIFTLSVIMTAIGLLQNKKLFLILLIAISVLIGWYIQVIRVDFYNELAWQEFTQGTSVFEPSDGASGVFALMFGWFPSLLLSLIIIGIQNLFKHSFSTTHNKTLQPTPKSGSAEL